MTHRPNVWCEGEFHVSVFDIVLPLLLDLLLSSVLELELDTMHSAFVDWKQKQMFNGGGADKSPERIDTTKHYVVFKDRFLRK